MSAQDYACVTVRGRAPWGFQLRESDKEQHRCVRVHLVEEDSHAFMAGLYVDDELVSVNGVSCACLSLAEVLALIEKATDCLQLLVKRCCLFPEQKFQPANSTLHASWRELREPSKSEDVDESHYTETHSDSEGNCPEGNTMVRTQFCIPALKDRAGADGGPRLEITPGAVVELQLSLGQTTLEDTGCTSLGSALGVTGHLSETNTENNAPNSAPGSSFYIPLHEREPLGQRGVLVSSPSALLGQVEVTIQPSGRDSQKVGAGGNDATANEPQDYDKGEGGLTDEGPTSFSVSFGIPSEEDDSESEREPNKPNKHRARHARLRRSESLSEKQVKEAKSKCKRIALLLTAATPNPNNKGLLMFKKHRQRAKQYTLISYGTGENEPEFDDYDSEYSDKETHAVEFTVLATSETEIDEDIFKNSSGHKNIVTFDLDTGLLQIEHKLNKQDDMNALPETKGKGAVMFAQRRQRIDEISAEHEDMRSKGIPVESIQEAEKNYQPANAHPCVHTNDSQNYTDMNVHQEHQQYQQYQEQHYQQHQQYQEFQQQYYQQQQHYQQQQECQQAPQYQLQQSQQQLQVQQQYFQNLNGVSSNQANVAQSSVLNRSAKPFSAQNRAAAPFPPSAHQEQPYYSDGQGEQIASRDERISVPAIKTGILQDTRRKNKAKPMFTFKEPQKVSPNPELLNLLNRKDKKAGFDSGTEEDYLSLGAEACNFLQSSKVKNKTPPPVAPKPHIHPVSPQWSPQPELGSQQFHQTAENNIPVTAKDSVPEALVVPEQEPSISHAACQNKASTTLHLQVNQEAVNNWGMSETQIQSGQQIDTWHENQSQPQLHAKPEPAISSWGSPSTQVHEQPPVTTWAAPAVPSQVISQNEPQMQLSWVTQSPVLSGVQQPTAIQTQSQPQLSWTTQSQPQHQLHHQQQSQINTWETASSQPPHQPPWTQSQVPGHTSVNTWSQDLNQPQVQPSWAQQHQESQPIPHWEASQQHPQSPWIQSQSQPQSQPAWVSQTQSPVNTWNQSQSLVQTPPSWTQQAPPSTQPPAQMQHQQNPWTSVPLQSQPHQAWAPQPQEPSQQAINSWAPDQNKTHTPWSQPQSPAQAQTPWSYPPQQQTPQQSHSQTVVSTWTPQPQKSPVITKGSTESQKLAQPYKPWSPPQTSQQPSSNQMNANPPSSKAPSRIPGMAPASGLCPAFEMPALRGKGAELFAKRQSRMEKYVVDSSTVQANKARSLSPSPSLPASWKYSPNCRAPPPLAYNPLQSPSYPLGVAKQPSSSSPALKDKNKSTEKGKPAPKPLNVLDVMKHQPYQLNSSLFTYGPAAEKIAAEKEAAEKLAAQKAQAQAQAQAQSQIQPQAPDPYAFIPEQPQPPGQSYTIPVSSPAMHDGPYQHPPNSYQPTPNVYQQDPYQQIYHLPHAYQQPPSNSYQQLPSIPYQQPPPYQSGPYPASEAPCYQPPPSSYVVPTGPVAGRAESATGSITSTAPKPKFSAKKSDAQALGRSSSLSPPVRLSPLGLGSRSASVSPSPTPSTHASYVSRSTERHAFWLDKGHKPPTPWQAASRHPLGLVDEAFVDQDMQHSIATNLRSAAHRKMLPEPPAEWKARVAYEPTPKSQGWRTSPSSLPFLSPTKSTASAPAAPVPYRSPLRQSQPPRSMTEAHLGSPMSGLQSRRPLGQSLYRNTYSNTWRW